MVVNFVFISLFDSHIQFIRFRIDVVFHFNECWCFVSFYCTFKLLRCTHIYVRTYVYPISVNQEIKNIIKQITILIKESLFFGLLKKSFVNNKTLQFPCSNGVSPRLWCFSIIRSNQLIGNNDDGYWYLGVCFHVYKSMINVLWDTFMAYSLSTMEETLQLSIFLLV